MDGRKVEKLHEIAYSSASPIIPLSRAVVQDVLNILNLLFGERFDLDFRRFHKGGHICFGGNTILIEKLELSCLKLKLERIIHLKLRQQLYLKYNLHQIV